VGLLWAGKGKTKRKQNAAKKGAFPNHQKKKQSRHGEEKERVSQSYEKADGESRNLWIVAKTQRLKGKWRPTHGKVGRNVGRSRS